VSRTNIIYIAVGACAVVAWACGVDDPGARLDAYTRLWQRVVAGLLSLYVAAVMASAGIALGVLLVPWVWDRIHS